MTWRLRSAGGWLVVVLCAAHLYVGPAGAQAPDGDTLTADPLPDESVPTEVVDAEPTRTRRPRYPTQTQTATSTATETATAIPATVTATRTIPPTASATVPPTMTATPTPTLALLAQALGGGGATLILPFAAGGLLALCAVWLGARLAGARERATRKRARATQASAMLLELRRLDAVLRRLVALDNPSSFPSLDHPIMEASLRDLTLFEPETAARIAQFHGGLRGIQHEIGDYRDNPLRWAGRLGELNQLIKGRATAACRVVPELVKALEKEGGAPPPTLGEPAAARSDPERLPPPPFGASDGDDWTM